MRSALSALRAILAYVQHRRRLARIRRNVMRAVRQSQRQAQRPDGVR